MTESEVREAAEEARRDEMMNASVVVITKEQAKKEMEEILKFPAEMTRPAVHARLAEMGYAYTYLGTADDAVNVPGELYVMTLQGRKYLKGRFVVYGDGADVFYTKGNGHRYMIWKGYAKRVV